MNENNTTTSNETKITEIRSTPFHTFIKYLVAFFIWLGILFVPGFIIAAFKTSLGITFGAIPTVLIYSPFFWLCKKSTEKWFGYYKEKKIKPKRKKAKHQTTPTILNSDIVDEQGEEKKNDDLNEIGVSGKSNRKKSNNFSFLNIIYLILSGISMLSIVVALNIQDIKRNELEHWNTTIVYLTILFIFVLFVSFSIYSLVKKKYKLVSAVSPILLLVLLVSYIEGSVFSRCYIKTNSYSFLQWYDNYEDVAVCNAIWIFSVILICVIAFIPIISLFISRCKEKYFRSVKYREKCYDRVAKLHNHLEKGIISESEYEKTKKDILKSIK